MNITNCSCLRCMPCQHASVTRLSTYGAPLLWKRPRIKRRVPQSHPPPRNHRRETSVTMALYGLRVPRPARRAALMLSLFVAPTRNGRLKGSTIMRDGTAATVGGIPSQRLPKRNHRPKATAGPWVAF
jgi:hypothetical protein